MRKKYYRKKKRGPVVSKKVEYDGITFASGLEKYMYIMAGKLAIKLIETNHMAYIKCKI